MEKFPGDRQEGIRREEDLLSQNIARGELQLTSFEDAERQRLIGMGIGTAGMAMLTGGLAWGSEMVQQAQALYQQTNGDILSTSQALMLVGAAVAAGGFAKVFKNTI